MAKRLLHLVNCTLLSDIAASQLCVATARTDTGFNDIQQDRVKKETGTCSCVYCLGVLTYLPQIRPWPLTECEGLCLTYLKQIRPWPLTECEGLCLHRTQFSNSWYCYIVTTAAALLENSEASARLTTANGGTFTLTSPRLSSQSCYSMLDWRTLTWLATATGWARSKCSAICSGKLISVYMIWYDVNRRYGI